MTIYCVINKKQAVTACFLCILLFLRSVHTCPMRLMFSVPLYIEKKIFEFAIGKIFFLLTLQK